MSDAHPYRAAYQAVLGHPQSVVVASSPHRADQRVAGRLADLWPHAKISFLNDVQIGELAKTSVDVLIDARSRGQPEAAEDLLRIAWPAVKIGGRVCFENIQTKRNTSNQLHTSLTGSTDLQRQARQSSLPPTIASIFQEHDSFLIDTLRGLRQRLNGQVQSQQLAPLAHTHVLVLRKRLMPRHRRVSVLMGKVAMKDMDASRLVEEMSKLNVVMREQEGSVVRAATDAQTPSTASLEDLAYAVGTDKQHDDHKYTDFYAALLDETSRRTAHNVTEVGVMYGQSMVLWNEYFSQAHIWGFDNWIRQSVRTLLRRLPRVHYQWCNTLDTRSLCGNAIKLEQQSMDLIIDDGAHKPEANERTLSNFWPLLRQGGYFVIEDVLTGGNQAGQFVGMPANWSAQGSCAIAHDPRYRLMPGTVRRLQENPAFLVDTTIGHRALGKFQREVSPKWFKDDIDHNTHLLVIQRRAT